MTLAVDVTRKGIKALEGASTEDIAKLLKDANDAYYNVGEPLLTDDLFDLTKDYLEKRDPKNPILKQIGAIVTGTKVKLPEFMGSLDKIRDDPKALANWIKKYKDEYVISDKLDGNSALYYINAKGKTSLYSRGDGAYGQDISNLLTFLNLPIPQTTPLAVRGELIISKAKWKTISHKGANARNMVAGVMHSKHPDPEVASQVTFIAYELLKPAPTTPKDGFTQMKEMGFECAHSIVLKEDDMTMTHLSEILMERRSKSPFEVDGIVVMHNESHPRGKSKNPKYAFAFKSLLTHDEAEVIVKEVEWNASKDGYLKPIVHFDPVTLAGASIRKATGFNANYIEQNKIGPGSRIIIIRSGDVIPFILKVLTPSANKQPAFPDMDFTWNDTHIDIQLANQTDNAEIQLKVMVHFVTTLQMKGLAAGLLKKMYEQANITTINKLIHVKAKDLQNVEGFQTKITEKVIAAIADGLQRAKCIDLMTASNVFGRGLGSKKLQVILNAYPKIVDGILPSEQELIGNDGIGATTAKQFLETYPKFQSFLKETGLVCKKQVQQKKSSHSSKKSVNGLHIVFTGFRNKEWETRVTDLGGKVSSSVSKNTSFIVAKDPTEDSGKLNKARDIGLTIIGIEEFEKTYHF